MSNKIEVIDLINEETKELTPFNVEENIKFTEPEEGKVPQAADSKQPPILFNRIHYKKTNSDGTLGDVITRIGPCFSFGVSENTDQKSGELTGYQLTVVMYDRDGATDHQRACVDHFDRLSVMGRTAVLANKKAIKKGGLVESDLRTFNILYRKKDEDGNPIESESPVLYTKLICSRKDDNVKILTNFTLMDIVDGKTMIMTDDKKEPIQLDPKKLIGKFGICEVYVKTESIFSGSKITPQIKAWDVYYKPIETALPRLRHVSEKNTIMVTKDSNPATALLMMTKGGKDDETKGEQKEGVAPQPPAGTANPLNADGATGPADGAPAPGIKKRTVNRPKANKPKE